MPLKSNKPITNPNTGRIPAAPLTYTVDGEGKAVLRLHGEERGTTLNDPDDHAEVVRILGALLSEHRMNGCKKCPPAP